MRSVDALTRVCAVTLTTVGLNESHASMNLSSSTSVRSSTQTDVREAAPISLYLAGVGAVGSAFLPG